jgi:hypothetical protein
LNKKEYHRARSTETFQRAEGEGIRETKTSRDDIVGADDPMARGTYRYRRGAVIALPSLLLQIFRILFALALNAFKPFSECVPLMAAGFGRRACCDVSEDGG